MFTFYIENHDPFGSLTKNCPKLDKNNSIVSSFQYLQSANGQLVQFKKVTMQDVSVFVSECLYLHIYFLIFQ